MSSINKVILVGRVGKDPELRRMQSGDPVVSFSLATSENWTDKASGERKEKTEWHDVVIYNEGLAKVAESYLRKGSRVYIEGQLQTREWDDAQSGQKRRRTEIVLQRFRGELVLLDGKKDGDEVSSVTRAAPRDSGAYADAKPAPARQQERERPRLDDEIPF